MIIKSKPNGYSVRPGYFQTELTEKQQFAYDLKNKSGYTVTEISQIMDISRNSVYTHLNYAKSKFRRWGKKLAQRKIRNFNEENK